MSEQTTRSLDGGDSFETRVLAEFAQLNNRLTDETTAIRSQLTMMDGRLTSVEGRLTSLDERLTVLEEKVEARLHDTRPIWEAVLERLEKIETRLESIDSKFEVVGGQLLDMRGDVNMLKKRVPPAA